MEIIKATTEQVERLLLEISAMKIEHLHEADCYNLQPHSLGCSLELWPKRFDRESFPDWIFDRLSDQFGLFLGNTETLVGVWSTDACAMCNKQFGRHGAPTLFSSQYAPTDMRDKYIHRDCLQRWSNDIYESSHA